MATITLDDRDSAILRRLDEGDADVESLAEEAACPPAYLRDRLPELADNGLVRRSDEGDYRLTDDGRRVLAGSPAGTENHRIDTPPDVEERIESFDLRLDRESAVRAAFAFLQYWGSATESEIADAVYSEFPAGFGSEAEWWDECVRDHIEELPAVEPPESSDRPWRYARTPTVEKRTDDGRRVLDDEVAKRSSAKFALERLELDDAEREAVRAAFDRLVREGELSATEAKSRTYPDHDAGYDSASAWWDDCIRDAFEALPGVERSAESEDDERSAESEDVWQFRRSAEGPMSSDPGAEIPDEPLGSLDDEE